MRPLTGSGEQTVRKLFTAIDAQKIDVATSLMTEDVFFRFGSAEPTVGREAFVASSAALAAVLAGISHELSSVWTTNQPEPAVICEMDVTYLRLDSTQVTLPCVNIFRLRDGLIADYRIYMDINPVFATA